MTLRAPQERRGRDQPRRPLPLLRRSRRHCDSASGACDSIVLTRRLRARSAPDLWMAQGGVEPPHADSRMPQAISTDLGLSGKSLLESEKVRVGAARDLG